jgi:hypothetical protein
LRDMNVEHFFHLFLCFIFLSSIINSTDSEDLKKMCSSNE